MDQPEFCWVSTGTGWQRHEVIAIGECAVWVRRGRASYQVLRSVCRFGARPAPFRELRRKEPQPGPQVIHKVTLRGR